MSFCYARTNEFHGEGLGSSNDALDARNFFEFTSHNSAARVMSLAAIWEARFRNRYSFHTRGCVNVRMNVNSVVPGDAQRVGY
jgi:hypothetical protein